MLALTRCKQNEFDTLSGGQLVVEQFIKDHPYIKKLIKRSDNASVLGGHSTAEAEKILHEQVGITLLERNYSEVQHERDICDRLAGAAKMRLKSYVNSGNNVLTVHDIKRGFDYCGGIKNTRVAVAEVDKRLKALEKSHIPEISSIRSVENEKDDMIIRKASNVGKGFKVPFRNLQIQQIMKIIESFNSLQYSKQQHTTSNSQRKDRRCNVFYFCNNNAYTSVFENEDDLLSHIASNQHTTVEQGTKRTSGDIARMQLFEKMQQTNISSRSSTQATITTIFNQPSIPKHMAYLSEQGWALRVKLFDEGGIYGTKVSAEEVVRRMRTERNSHGSKIVTPDQYLTENQVNNQFKQLHSINKKSKTTMQVDIKDSSPDRAKRTFTRTSTRSRKAISNGDIVDENNGHGNIPIRRKAKLPASHSKKHRSILDNFDEDDDMLLSDIKNTFQKMTPLVQKPLIAHTDIRAENND
ncbi:unnamed protein product [Didymodactylos carnosus]|uniref:Uncharacterized protein n=1 Tax=Didymodactylos carnosus TaxID=1234261 RepID=A0A814I920_9BILA|nr:unnamed protein product [Didymodactylos carnosus]CAF3791168.1 unnamed protein product [Didymodactylos carnosus]